ncbi:MAG: alpha/beta fold hydrolase [Bacteroidota bacterium]
MRKLRAHELVVLEEAAQWDMQFGSFDIRMYRWGAAEDEKILLVHGWEGQAGNFADLIQKLLANSYQVIAFDGPSHGFSSKGKTSLFEFGSVVEAILQEHRCKKLVSHSFGGVPTTYALSRHPDIEIDRYVLLTTPDQFSQRVDELAASVGITEKVKRLLIERLEAEQGIDASTLSVSNFVQTANVRKALIIHDKDDRVISIAQSRRVCASWKNCQIKEIESTGHFRILRTARVLDDVVAFMN